MNRTGKILVTGATGMLGIHVMLELSRRGMYVKGLYRHDSNKEIARSIFQFYKDENLYDKIEWVEGDLLDRQSINSAIRDVEYVFHTASVVTFQEEEYECMWENNITGTANILDASFDNNIKAFCHVSSIGSIGHTSDNTPINEDTPYQPDAQRTVYSQSKFRQEMEVWKAIENGMNCVIVNPGVIIGPCDKSRSSGAIVDTIAQGMKFYTEGSTGYTDVRDVAKTMIELTFNKNYGQRYIIVSENKTVRDVENIFADTLGKKRPTLRATKRMMLIAAFCLKIISKLTGRKPTLTKDSICSMEGRREYSSEKLKNTINIEFTAIEDSIKNMVDYYNKHNNK